MAADKQPIALEKGLQAATVTGCLFRCENPVANGSDADVQIGLNTAR